MKNFPLRSMIVVALAMAATVPAALAGPSAPPTPEPTSAALLGIGALLLAARRRRGARS